MPKSNNQKLKLLYLAKILQERTDDSHRLSLKEIQSALLTHDINAERKSLYDDIEMLRAFGLDIIGESLGKGYVYYIGSRQFELAELKLLVDAVQASKFITVKKSTGLIKKLGSLTSNHEATKLKRQVYVADRIKTMNESIYYNVDILHNAIGSNVRICFQYTRWTVGKVLELKKGGEIYEVSPWALSWDNENYYLVAYDSNDGIIKHYRVDKMMKLSLTEKSREGREFFEKFNMASYSRKMFGMYHGKDELVKIQFNNDLAGVVIDRFGKDVTLRPVDESHFVAVVKVAVSMQFIAWIIGLSAGAKIISPDHVAAKMRETIDILREIYE
ncbi:MAG: WYL domain-containing protein [Lachnospiraceae bacterium]|nr:WYL domain-containing protein [Lachnospiraceae bacterium]